MDLRKDKVPRAFVPGLILSIAMTLAICCWWLLAAEQTESLAAVREGYAPLISDQPQATPTSSVSQEAHAVRAPGPSDSARPGTQEKAATNALRARDDKAGRPSSPSTILADTWTVSLELDSMTDSGAQQGQAESQHSTAGGDRAEYPVVFSVNVVAEGLCQPGHPAPNDVFSLGAVGWGYFTEGELFQSSGASLGMTPDLTNVDRLSAALGVGPAPGGPPFMGPFVAMPVPAPPGGPVGTLGLVPGDNLNALSFGEDGGCVFLFSVDPNAVGGPGTAVYNESTSSAPLGCAGPVPSHGGGDPGDEAAGDIFVSPNIGAWGTVVSLGPLTPAPPFSNTLWADEWFLGLQAPAVACSVIGPPEDDLDALEVDDGIKVDADMDGIPDLDTPVFFSLDLNSATVVAPTPDPFPGACTAPDPTGVTADDILVSGPLSASAPPLPPMAFAIYASGVQDIGLQSGDDFDALVLHDTGGPGGVPDGILTPGQDTALFSLAAGSPSLATAPGAPYYPGDVLMTTFNGSFSIGVSHLLLGLQTTDELNALDIGWWFPPSHGPVNHEHFSDSLARVTVDAGPLGMETIRLRGPSAVDVDLTTLADADGNGLDEVTTEMVDLQLTGNSVHWGPINVRLRPDTSDPFQRSWGKIEEQVNNTPGVLDLPPYTATGTATSYFDVFYEVDLPITRDTYYNPTPAHMANSKMSYKPPPPWDPRYKDPYMIEVNRNGVPSGIYIGDESHHPHPPPPDPHGTVWSNIEFGTGGTNPSIAADFFGPGSDPFDGGIPADAVMLNPFTSGDASNLFQRWGAPISPDDPVGTEGTVPLEFIALSLRSTAPIIVTYNGGLDPEEWDVAIDLSVMQPSVEMGTLTATKTHENGGVFDTYLQVLPRLTFTKVIDPTEERVLDTGLEEWDPLVFESTGTPWVQQVNPELDILAPDDGVFVPMVEETVPGDPTSQVTTEMYATSDAPAQHTMRPAVGICVTLDMYAEFVGCMDGPDMPVREECSPWDGNESDHVDLGDFVLFQRFICQAPPPLGACCAPATGICTDMTESECASFGWDFQGPGTICPEPPLPADPNPCVSPYCSAWGGCVAYIASVDGAIINPSGACHGYADYTWYKVGMPIGSDNLIGVTNGAPEPIDECGMWVDWNQDSDFDDPGEELVVTGTPGPGPYEAFISPPGDAVIGETRLRIRIVREQPLAPCGDTVYGEVEDYTIEVMDIP
jgi:hypothetical protein